MLIASNYHREAFLSTVKSWKWFFLSFFFFFFFLSLKNDQEHLHLTCHLSSVSQEHPIMFPFRVAICVRSACFWGSRFFFFFFLSSTVDNLLDMEFSCFKWLVEQLVECSWRKLLWPRKLPYVCLQEPSVLRPYAATDPLSLSLELSLLGIRALSRVIYYAVFCTQALSLSMLTWGSSVF